MTSSARRDTNRRNAQKSTGPRSAAGKQRASQNARKHGLSAAATLDAVATEEVIALAKLIAGSASADPVVLMAARTVAEAQMDLKRVRDVRSESIAKWWTTSEKYVAKYPAELAPFYSPEIELQVAEMRSAVQRAGEQVTSDPQEAKKLKSLFRASEVVARATKRVLTVLERDERNARRTLIAKADDALREMRRLDRYERRVLSRRKKALRTLSAAQAAVSRLPPE